MKKPKKSARKNGEAEAPPYQFHGHLIRIPNKKARLRAIMVLGWVREPYCGFTDSRYLIGNEHLEVLRREKIPFEVLA
jgi:hypothetical protein